MERTCFALLHVVLLVHCLSACLAGNVTDITSDQSSLLTLKAHIILNSRGVLANNWSTTTSICNWNGVTCGTRHLRVTSLNISNMALEGTIPPHLGNLSFLVSLDLSTNNFSGHLPYELSHLRRLKFMNLKINKFSGQLPSWLGVLSELQELILRNNSFTGTIPPSLSNISMLEHLDLSSNFLHGMIPQEVGNLQHLKILNMQYNQFVGSVPLTIFNISSLQLISFAKNSLSSNLPLDMCHRLPNLQWLSLSYNELHGEIPSSLYECSQLQILSLSFNKFNGPIRRGIWNSTVLAELYLGNNNLEGEIPEDMGNLRNLEILSIRYARLIGRIPSSIFNITSLKGISFFANNLTEYGFEGSVSTRSDVYSYGIMLMETFTRRKPTDDLFAGDLSLKDWVNQSLPDAIIHVVDSNLLWPEEDNYTAKVQCLSSIMELGLKCSAESPHERINMKDALIVLKKIKLQLIKNCK
ncbi:probable LRR receptor-like serine/threonine-protein kinase At3g47570 isoform X3 [Cornus florida]|uniref:probable LRR receptor-like serine/threonine-protein kinase At3g47570 isoform X3 n=1 Tax=Cornus florida TaxID=4283 RepID=UPI00289A6446|nr:probable LRR receptor-like serine/threonine-protein kinase At3g47570 isoform X3 [Cornus florida]